jgi:hypothetical protein
MCGKHVSYTTTHGAVTSPALQSAAASKSPAIVAISDVWSTEDESTAKPMAKISPTSEDINPKLPTIPKG